MESRIEKMKNIKEYYDILSRRIIRFYWKCHPIFRHLWHVPPTIIVNFLLRQINVKIALAITNAVEQIYKDCVLIYEGERLVGEYPLEWEEWRKIVNDYSYIYKFINTCFNVE